MHVFFNFGLALLILAISAMGSTKIHAGENNNAVYNLGWCNQIKPERQRPLWNFNYVTVTVNVVCQFPSKGERPFKESARNFLNTVTEGFKSERLQQILDDGRAINYTDEDGRNLANKILQGPILERQWSYADFFQVGLVVEESNGQVEFQGDAPVVLRTLAGDDFEVLAAFWKKGGGQLYRMDTRSFNEDEEELKIRNTHFVNSGEDFFVHNILSSGVFLNSDPHQYVQAVNSRYWIVPQANNKHVMELRLKATIKANHTGDALRHRSREEFVELVVGPFTQTVKRKFDKLLPSLVEHF